MVKEQTKRKRAPKKAKGGNGKKTDSNLIGQGNRQLKGMTEICDYTGFSAPTILGWIRDADFPATKTAGAGGIWISTTKKVDQWREGFFGS